MINNLGMDTIEISDGSFISIVSNEKNNIFWKEVYLNVGTEVIFIGSLFTHRDVINYNDNYIGIMSVTRDENNIPTFKVKKIYDIKNRELIMGTSEELLDFYENEFLHERVIRPL